MGLREWSTTGLWNLHGKQFPKPHRKWRKSSREPTGREELKFSQINKLIVSELLQELHWCFSWMQKKEVSTTTHHKSLNCWSTVVAACPPMIQKRRHPSSKSPEIQLCLLQTLSQSKSSIPWFQGLWILPQAKVGTTSMFYWKKNPKICSHLLGVKCKNKNKSDLDGSLYILQVYRHVDLWEPVGNLNKGWHLLQPHIKTPSQVCASCLGGDLHKRSGHLAPPGDNWMILKVHSKMSHRHHVT